MTMTITNEMKKYEYHNNKKKGTWKYWEKQMLNA